MESYIAVGSEHSGRVLAASSEITKHRAGYHLALDRPHKHKARAEELTCDQRDTTRPSPLTAASPSLHFFSLPCVLVVQVLFVVECSFAHADDEETGT